MLTLFEKSAAAIPNICRLLINGAVVALPTETAYGLAADAFSGRTIGQVIKLKGRERGKPIALMAADLKMVRQHFYLTSNELSLAKKFWPGPLTILLKPKRIFSKDIVSSAGLVGVRVPGDEWLRKLLSAVGRPLTATSANLAGKATPYTVALVKRALSKRGLKYLVNGGSLKHRKVSTVVSLRRGRLEIVRPGAVSAPRLEHMVS